VAGGDPISGRGPSRESKKDEEKKKTGAEKKKNPSEVRRKVKSQPHGPRGRGGSHRDLRRVSKIKKKKETTWRQENEPEASPRVRPVTAASLPSERNVCKRDPGRVKQRGSPPASHLGKRSSRR